MKLFTVAAVKSPVSPNGTVFNVTHGWAFCDQCFCIKVSKDDTRVFNVIRCLSRGITKVKDGFFKKGNSLLVHDRFPENNFNNVQIALVSDCFTEVVHEHKEKVLMCKRIKDTPTVIIVIQLRRNDEVELDFYGKDDSRRRVGLSFDEVKGVRVEDYTYPDPQNLRRVLPQPRVSLLSWTLDLARKGYNKYFRPDKFW